MLSRHDALPIFRPRLLPFRSAAVPWLPLRPPLRIGSACIVAFPHQWQAKNDRVIFQVETWFMFHYWMRRGLASTSQRKPKGVTRGRPPHGRVLMRTFARWLRRAILDTSAL